MPAVRIPPASSSTIVPMRKVMPLWDRNVAMSLTEELPVTAPATVNIGMIPIVTTQ